MQLCWLLADSFLANSVDDDGTRFYILQFSNTSCPLWHLILIQTYVFSTIKDHDLSNKYHISKHAKIKWRPNKIVLGKIKKDLIVRNILTKL